MSVQLSVCSVADPVPGSGAFLTAGDPGWVISKDPDPGYGKNILDHIS